MLSFLKRKTVLVLTLLSLIGSLASPGQEALVDAPVPDAAAVEAVAALDPAAVPAPTEAVAPFEGAQDSPAPGAVETPPTPEPPPPTAPTVVSSSPDGDVTVLPPAALADSYVLRPFSDSDPDTDRSMLGDGPIIGPYAYYYEGMLPVGGGSGPATVPPSDPTLRADAGIGLFGGGFDPETAHFRVGPLYFQAVHLETGVLYSDYHGPQVFAPENEDGWLSFAGFRFRLAAALGEKLTLSVDGTLIYLFETQELGFRSGLGTGLGPFASLSYETRCGYWEVRAFAEFGSSSLWGDADYADDAYDRAGRYSFGFYGSRDDRDQTLDLFYDPYLYSRLGVEATRPVNPDWRISLLAEHTDYWYLGDDSRDDHDARDHFRALYGAEPGRIPFSPWVSYDLYSDNGFDTTYHTAYIGGDGRLSENVFLDARAGYFWTANETTEDERWLWNLGLRHQISERTVHGVSGGQDFFLSDYSFDTVVSNYLRYYIGHQASQRLRLYGYAQWSTDEFLSGPLVGGEYERELYGAWADYTLTERLRASVRYYVENRRNTENDENDDRSVFQSRLDLRYGERTSVYFLYQHEDTDSFYEDLYMVGLVWHF